MFRSQKHSIKKVEPPKVDDPDRQAFILYLGDLEEEQNEGAAAQK